MRSSGSPGRRPRRRRKPPDDEVLRETLAIHHPHLVSPVLETYVTHPAVCEVLARVTAAHLPHWDGRVKAMQTMVFVKPPGFPGQAWHQDEVFIPTRDRSLLGAWIAIDDATTENGCLWVLPGSHRDGYLYPLREHGHPDEFDVAPESYGFDDSARCRSSSRPAPRSSSTATSCTVRGRTAATSTAARSSATTCNAWSLLPGSHGSGRTTPTSPSWTAGRCSRSSATIRMRGRGTSNPDEMYVRQRDRRRYETSG